MATKTLKDKVINVRATSSTKAFLQSIKQVNPALKSDADVVAEALKHYYKYLISQKKGD